MLNLETSPEVGIKTLNSITSSGSRETTQPMDITPDASNLLTVLPVSTGAVTELNLIKNTSGTGSKGTIEGTVEVVHSVETSVVLPPVVSSEKQSVNKKGAKGKSTAKGSKSRAKHSKSVSKRKKLNLRLLNRRSPNSMLKMQSLKH